MFFDLGLIRYIRQNKNLTQDYLAKKANINNSYISRLEANTRNVSPTLNTIRDIAAALNVCPKLILTCNCKSCPIVKDPFKRLECKKNALKTYSKAIAISANLVEYELKNFDKLDKGNLSYGDSKYIRENKLM